MLDNKPKEHNKTMHNENPNPLARHRVFTGLVILAVATTIVGTNAGNAGKAVTTSNAASTAIAVNPAIPSSEAVGLDVYQATSASSIASYVSFIGIAGAISGSTSNPATPDVKGTQKQ